MSKQNTLKFIDEILSDQPDDRVLAELIFNGIDFEHMPKMDDFPAEITEDNFYKRLHLAQKYKSILENVYGFINRYISDENTSVDRSDKRQIAVFHETVFAEFKEIASAEVKKAVDFMNRVDIQNMTTTYKKIPIKKAKFKKPKM